MLNLEQLLAEDRIKFEQKLIPLHDKPAEQYSQGVSLFTQLVSDVLDAALSIKQQNAYPHERVDAFMYLLVNYKIAPGVGLHVLRSTVKSADRYANRQALVDYLKGCPRAGLTSVANAIDEVAGESLCASKSLMSAEEANDPQHQLKEINLRGFFAKVDQLQAYCEEYEEWMANMRRLAPTANPKNHPTTGQLRERDAIRVKINELATPEVIAHLVRIARAERDSQ
ncbi:hypothetical protein pEaSNUABM37_00099 [Erwinia phage pEa_SNUABM_37]|nr:hypothetical protein pEaSNUABM37_00099 [Erwinia phage pEa_SNUABM_37]QXO10569.1 hypothetical protein pEaSNUABM48_00099 [Erwinia phage pEa_SNUABM_48]